MTLQHRLVFLPHCNSICERFLIDEGILSSDQVFLEEMSLDLIPLDEDLLSIELSTLRECELDGISSSTITAVARSIHKLQTICGVIPRLQGLDPLSEQVIQKVMNMRLEEYMQQEENTENNDTVDMVSELDISAMLIIDRKVDLITPMVTPLTYEALVDEIMDINCGFIKVDSSITQSTNDDESQSSLKVALALNTSDELFSDVRNQNVEKFGSFLQDQVKALKEHHVKFTTKKDYRDLNQIHA